MLVPSADGFRSRANRDSLEGFLKSKRTIRLNVGREAVNERFQKLEWISRRHLDKFSIETEPRGLAGVREHLQLDESDCPFVENVAIEAVRSTIFVHTSLYDADDLFVIVGINLADDSVSCVWA